MGSGNDDNRMLIHHGPIFVLEPLDSSKMLLVIRNQDKIIRQGNRGDDDVEIV